MFKARNDGPGIMPAWAGTCLAYWLPFDDLRPLADWLGALDAALEVAASRGVQPHDATLYGGDPGPLMVG